MKNKYWIYLPVIGLLLMFSCKKETRKPNGSSSLVIVNGMAGSSLLFTNFDIATPQHFNPFPQFVGYKSYVEIGSHYGNVPLALTDYQDTTKIAYKLTLDLPVNTMHSLFLTGTLAAPESFVTTDLPPYHSITDSVAGVRFVNLSPGSSPLSINIQGKANASEMSNLAFKKVSDFKTYPATSTISDYVFEIRDEATGNLLTTYDYGDLARFNNVTIVICGADNNSLSTFLVKNY